jgi:pyruvate,water dikinase
VNLVLDWHEAFASNAAACGGKGWNLARLSRYGFPVPAGGVLVAEAYRRFMEIGDLRRKREEIARLDTGSVLEERVEQGLEQFRKMIGAAPLPAEIEEALQGFLAESGLSRVPVAVRSSATAEDGPWSSFAGIHQSVLNVTGVEAVVKAVRACWGSLWTPQAVAYRRRWDLSDSEVACAVAIMAMVGTPDGGPPRCSGVAFSCDPRNGRRDAVRINAAPGLGEELVSGRVNPDDWLLVLEPDGLRVEEKSGTSLTEDEARRVARLALRAQAALGESQDPHDIEWAHDGTRIWMVQARPVTRVPRRTWPGGENLPVIWSNGNLKDAIPGVMSEFTWSCVRAALGWMMFGWMDKLDRPMPPGIESSRRFHGRAYFDLTTCQWFFYDVFGTLPEATNRGMGGHQPAVPVPKGNPFAGPKGRARSRASMRLLWEIRKYRKQYPVFREELLRAAREGRARQLESLAQPELLEFAMKSCGDGIRSCVRAMLGNMAMAWQTILEDFLRWRLGDRANALAAGLIAGSGRVSSADYGWRLGDLADVARGDADAAAWLARTPLEPHGWSSLPETSPFRREMARFLDDFGHRAVYELEYENPRWREDPTYLLEHVRAALASPPRPRSSAKAVADGAWAEVKRRTWLWRPLVKWLTKLARLSAEQREEMKSVLVAMMEPMRRIALEVGRRLAAEGAIARAEDVFQLAWPEVEGWLRGEWDGMGARELVAGRNAARARWLTEEAPDVLILDVAGRPAELPESMQPAAPAAAADGKALKGVGIAPGRATGAARLIRHPSEGLRLQPGDVLIAPSTDPGWTPLFLRVSAVVVEVGGILSHGAIIAREYGLPAVSNVPGILKTVKEGEIVTVDGDAGTVTRG